MATPSTMKVALFIFGYLIFATSALAGINWQGESSHAAGGALLAGAITATVGDKYWPEHRAIIGFSASTAEVLIGEGYQMITQGEQFTSSLQDVIAHTIGAIIGATITDRYILMPFVEHGPKNSSQFGMFMQMSFQ